MVKNVRVYHTLILINIFKLIIDIKIKNYLSNSLVSIILYFIFNMSHMVHNYFRSTADSGSDLASLNPRNLFILGTSDSTRYSFGFLSSSYILPYL